MTEDEPEPTKYCANCKHVFKPDTEEPCKGCNKSMHSRWERWEEEENDTCDR